MVCQARSSPTAHCVMAYAQPSVDTSVKMHACIRRSRNNVHMVCINDSCMVSHACWCSDAHPACWSDIRLAAIMSLPLTCFIALVRNWVSFDDASEKRAIFSRIHPTAELNCQTSPTFFGRGIFASHSTRSGSTVIPCRVIALQAAIDCFFDKQLALLKKVHRHAVAYCRTVWYDRDDMILCR